MNKAPEKEQRREPKAINNFDDNFPSPPKRPKNNFKKTYDSWNDRPFKDKSKKPFDSAKEDEFRFKKKRKKPRKEDEPSKPAKVRKVSPSTSRFFLNRCHLNHS